MFAFVWVGGGSQPDPADRVGSETKVGLPGGAIRAEGKGRHRHAVENGGSFWWVLRPC